ncbi:MAG: serine/threonine protein phosphatase [Oscillospiraceae bacterium]|nr:serine/threonine protein phosphatase [Oscillospiraceae bacterium]
MRRKQKKQGVGAVCQLRNGSVHPFGGLRGFVPLGGGEERVYREMREAIPVLDAAVGKMVRLCGGFTVKCRDKEAQLRLERFLDTVPCGRGQVGMDSFLSGYLDSLLTYGRAIGEMVVAGGRLRAVCWGDVTELEVQEGENVLDMVIWGRDEKGLMRPLPYQHLLLFTVMNPEPGHPYGVSMFRGMPFLADILMKIYHTIGSNWERAGNVRYSVICKGSDELDGAAAQERGKQVAAEWSRAMEDCKNGTVRDFVAVGDVEIKVIGGEAPILDSEVPVRQILEQLVAKTGLPPFLLGLNWSTTERMSTQQADILTSELWALRRTVEPAVRKVCRMFLALEGLDDTFEVVWDDISLQDIQQEAQAELYKAQAEKYRAEAQLKIES